KRNAPPPRRAVHFASMAAELSPVPAELNTRLGQPVRRGTVSFQNALTAIFGTALLLLAAALVGLQFVRSERIVRSATLGYMDRLAIEAELRTVDLLSSPSALVETMAVMPALNSASRPGTAVWPVLVEALRQLPQLYGAYVGYDDGNFLQIVA